MTEKTFEENKDITTTGKAEKVYDNLYYTGTSLELNNVQADYTFQLQNDKGNILKLDFNGDTLKTSGDLKPDEASQIFLDWVDFQFKKKWITKQRVKEAIKKAFCPYNWDSDEEHDAGTAESILRDELGLEYE